nr:hypothetical protein BdHM001_35920 [Bdellovibrio sp. HM001]
MRRQNILYAAICVFCIHFVAANIAFAKLSVGEIEERALKNSIKFERGAIFNTEAGVTEHMIKVTQSKYPNFKPQMWYYHFFEKDNIGYYISYDWTDNKCVMTTISTADLKKGPKALKQLREVNGEVVDSNRTRINMKVCEKLYNFYSSK